MLRPVIQNLRSLTLSSSAAPRMLSSFWVSSLGLLSTLVNLKRTFTLLQKEETQVTIARDSNRELWPLHYLLQLNVNKSFNYILWNPFSIFMLGMKKVEGKKNRRKGRVSQRDDSFSAAPHVGLLWLLILVERNVISCDKWEPPRETHLEPIWPSCKFTKS